MSLDGIQPVLITSNLDAFDQGSGLTWQEGGRIIYSYADAEGLWAVPARGGDPVNLLKPVLEVETDFHHPQALPGSEALLMVTHTSLHGSNRLEVVQGSRRKLLLENEGGPIWTPAYSPPGHILYRRTQGTEGLWAIPFSLEDMAVTGQPFMVDPGGSFPQAAADGTLIYLRGAAEVSRFLVWMDREGKVLERIGEPQSRITAPAISPDGRRAAAMGRDRDNWGIWVHNLETGLRTRINFGGVQDWDPAWTPDGHGIVYWDGATRTISKLAADGTGEVEPLVREKFTDSGDPGISPDGRMLYFWAQESDQPEAIYVRDLGEDGPCRKFLASAAKLSQPRLSPDGTLLAYASDEAGGNKIFLTSFPSGEGKWQVSRNEGENPRWRGDNGAIFYLQGSTLMEVEIQRSPTLRVGAPRPLFDVQETGAYLTGISRFDVGSDGQRFLMATADEVSESAAELVMIRNWTAEFTQADSAP